MAEPKDEMKAVDGHLVYTGDSLPDIIIKDDIKTVEVHSDVEEIEKGAFEDCEKLTTVTMGTGVKRINVSAFSGCESMTAFVASSTLLTIEKDAFMQCGLASLVGFGACINLKTIGRDAFCECTNLVSLEGMRQIKIEQLDQDTFNGCTNLASLAGLPPKLTTLGPYTFYECTKLASLSSLPAACTDVDKKAFCDCENMEALTGFKGDGESDKIAAFLRAQPFMYEFHFLCLDPSTNSDAIKASYDSFLNAEQWVPEVGKYCDVQWKTEYAQEWTPSVGGKCMSEDEDGDEGTATITAVHEDGSVNLKFDYTGNNGEDVQPSEFTRPECIKSEDEFYTGTISAIHDDGSIDADFSLDDKSAHVPPSYFRDVKQPPSAETQWNETPLHFACGNVNPEISPAIIQYLLSLDKSAATVQDKDGNTPLHIAARNPTIPKASLLLLINADPASLKIKNNDEETPLAYSATCIQPVTIQSVLFSAHPLNDNRLKPAAEFYLNDLVASPPTSLESSPPALQNGWVEFSSDTTLLEQLSTPTYNLVTTTTTVISACPLPVAKTLAYSVDLTGRSAIDLSVPAIKTALQSRLLFLGRYKIQAGPPLHKSATCVVVNADDYSASLDYIKEFETFNRSEISPTEFAALVSRFGFSWTPQELERQFTRIDADKSGFIDQAEFLEFCTSVLDGGGNRKVVVKFMKQKDQFEREKTSQTALESRYVIRASAFLSSPEFATAVKSVEEHDLTDYPHGIVMPAGDRNLLSIFQSERPSTAEIPLLMKQVAEAVHHLHSKDLMHGDIKMNNVVRQGNRLRLIDFDAAASLSNGSLAGAKFSSGVLPPEMFAKLTKDEKGKYNEYWKGVDEELQEKCRAKTTKRGKHMVVKTFAVEDDDTPRDLDALPFEPLEASPSLDVWSLGCMLFTMCR